MEELFTPDNVRSRLIFAGLKELETHGVSDFSLRRVSQECGVSCAAPYRHFKDKDELIVAVIEFVIEGWSQLSTEIAAVFSTDAASLVVELMVSGLRFWVGNGNFKTVMAASSIFSDGRSPLADFDKPIVRAVEKYAEENNVVDPDSLKFKLLAILYGAILLVDGGYESADKAAESMKKLLTAEL